MSKKITLAALALLAGGCSQSHPTATQAPAAQSSNPPPGPGANVAATASAITFTPPDGSFHIQMPKTPAEQDQTAPTATGTTTLHQYIAMANPHLGYMVGYSDYPPGQIKPAMAGKALDMGGKMMALAMGGKVQNPQAVTISGNPGRAITVQDRRGHTIHARFCFVESRLYQMAVMSETPDAMPKDADSYFQTFQLASK